MSNESPPPEESDESGSNWIEEFAEAFGQNAPDEAQLFKDRLFHSCWGEYPKLGTRSLFYQLDLAWSAISAEQPAIETDLHLHFQVLGNDSNSKEQTVKKWAAEKANEMDAPFLTYPALLADDVLLKTYREDQERRTKYFVLIEHNLQTSPLHYGEQEPTWLRDICRPGAVGLLLLSEFTRADVITWHFIKGILDRHRKSQRILVVATGYIPAANEQANGITDPTLDPDIHRSLSTFFSTFYFDNTLET